MVKAFVILRRDRRGTALWDAEMSSPAGRRPAKCQRMYRNKAYSKTFCLAGIEYRIQSLRCCESMFLVAQFS
jgi:hypothetical protein